MTTVEALLRDVADLGKPFTVGYGPRPDGSWRPLTALWERPSDLHDQIDAIAERIDTSERRVAASLAFSGLAARIVAPVLAGAALRDRLLVLQPEVLYWRPSQGDLVPLWIADGEVVPMNPDRLHAALTRPLAEIVNAVRQHVAVSELVLWGNATAAVGGVLRVLSRERPAARERAVRIAEDLIARRPWAGTGKVAVVDGSATISRRTCCLAYRIVGAVTCSNCVLGSGVSLRRSGGGGGRDAPSSDPSVVR
ncbi:(2Fe-2S)-binding protein [Actinomycetospora flava]|uniref:(2Fe-2S)-binding protein n=1 Tax=Actinomycetospora flava TaxID=3129232 RepID=A0ABU8MAH4_9PSEU